MNYPLHKTNKEHPEILTPAHSSYSDEYAQRMCDLYLSDHIERNEQGELQEYYRLHARDWHTPEMALAYDIKCPKCGEYNRAHRVCGACGYYKGEEIVKKEA